MPIAEVRHHLSLASVNMLQHDFVVPDMNGTHLDLSKLQITGTFLMANGRQCIVDHYSAIVRCIGAGLNLTKDSQLLC